MKKSTKNVLTVVGVLGAVVIGYRWAVKKYVDSHGGVAGVGAAPSAPPPSV